MADHAYNIDALNEVLAKVDSMGQDAKDSAAALASIDAKLDQIISLLSEIRDNSSASGIL